MIIERVEIWSDVKCNGGTHQGNIAKDEIFAASLNDDIDGRGDLTLEIDYNSTSWAAVQELRVLRVLYTDDTVGEYRITKPVKRRAGSGGGGAVLNAASIYNDLGNGVITRTEADGTVTLFYTLLSQTRDKLVDLILAAAPNYFSKGTITDSTTNVTTFTFDYDTPLKALTELAELEDLELAVRRNGDTDYKVDLVTQVGSSADTPEFRFRKNLLGVTREVDASELANRIYPGGGSDGAIKLSIGTSRWEVTNVNGLDITLAGNPIYADDVLNGYWVEDNIGIYEIQDCDATNQTVTLPTGHTVTQGELIWFREDTNGKQLVYVEDKDSQSTYGIISKPTDESDLPSTDNLVANGSIGDWTTASEPDYWSAYSTDSVMPTIVNSADESGLNPELYSKIGGGSAHVTATEAGQGIVCDSFNITPADPMLFYSGFVSLYIVSGVVEYWWEHQNEGRFPAEGAEEAAYTSETERWIDLSIEGKQYPESTYWMKLYVTAKDGAAEWYLDAAQFTNSAGNYPFFDGRAANELWRRGLRSLDDYANPQIKYSIDVLDLTAVDNTNWPYDAITLGGAVYIYDEELDIDATVRCLSVRRNLLTGHNTKLQLSNKQDDILDILTRRRRRKQTQSEPRPATARISSFIGGHKPDGTVTVKFIGAGSTRSFKYRIHPAIMPTIADVKANGSVNDNVDGTIIEAPAAAWSENGPRLTVGGRAFIRVLAYPLKNAGGVPGQTDTEVVGPISLEEPDIDGTSVQQFGNGDSSGGAIVRRSWTPNGRVKSIRVYRKIDAWPTLTGTANGSPDPEYDRGSVDNDDSWRYEDSGYATGDVVYDVAIPYDYNDNPHEANRSTGSYTVTGWSSGAPSSEWVGDPYFSWVSIEDTDDGTDCTSNRREVTIDWYAKNTTDSGQDVDVYRKVGGSNWEYIGTEENPYSTTTYIDYPPMYKHKPGEYIQLQYKLNLMTGSTIEDTEIKDAATTECIWCPE